MSEACRRCQRRQSSASVLPASRRSSIWQRGWLRKAEQRCAHNPEGRRPGAPRCHESPVFWGVAALLFHLRSGKDQRRSPQTNRWLLSIGYRNGDVIAHKPYKYFIYICTIKNALLVLEHVFLCVCVCSGVDLAVGLGSPPCKCQRSKPPKPDSASFANTDSHTLTHTDSHTRTNTHKNRLIQEHTGGEDARAHASSRLPTVSGRVMRKKASESQSGTRTGMWGEDGKNKKIEALFCFFAS